ncbi:MocR-like pyridoxine biosynthesis transcription factor PdxR [Paenibacillus dauci]|uniref:MocR-like pyridoxine biosynthesis transcription factor PdxR n=1 Tax=Paenibacillus dauci TaxID=1567106 RepID=UPI0006191FBD|nr:PLP-dependent aminotransferase family protein [Paenibacillus dauci]
MNELLINLNDTYSKYIQIYHFIRSLIEDGQLEENTALPSIRQLAKQLGVSRNTTLTAYEQLLAEGYIRSEPKKGYYVEPVEESITGVDRKVSSAELHIPDHPRPLIDFRIGSVDGQAFPLQKWRKCTNTIMLQPYIYTYGHYQGEPELRMQIAQYLLQSRGIRTSMDQLIIGSGTQQLLLHLSILLKINGYDSLAVEDPGYDGARTLFHMQGLQTEPVQVTSRGIDISELKRCKSRIAYVTPSHQFPTGAVLPAAERYQLLKWAEERQGYIIEDDYDSEFRYRHQPIPALASLQQGAQVIYLGTFSKGFLPSIRLSYMILPPVLMEQYARMFTFVEQSASVIHQQTMAYFMKQGYWSSHVRKMRAIYRRKMQVLVNALQESFGKQIRIIGSHSGLYILVELQQSGHENELIRQALHHGVQVYPTSRYYSLLKVDRKPTIQLGFSNLTIEQIGVGVQLLKEAWGRV